MTRGVRTRGRRLALSASRDVLSIKTEAPSVATFSLEFQDQERQSRYQVQPGQFNMIYVPGVGEVPISVSSMPRGRPGIGHTIRFTGRVTNVIGKLVPGAVVGLRGPYGRGWPIEQARGRDILLVTGGLGLAPMRPVVRAFLADRGRYGRLMLLHGARQPADLLYVSEYPEWERQGMEMMITVDHADETWHGRVGVVPFLFNRLRIDAERTVVLTCGPEILMRFAVSEALNRRLNDGDIYYSMERNMQCAVGHVRPLPARAGLPLQGRPRIRSPRARAVLSARSYSDRNRPGLRVDKANAYHETTTGRLQVRVVRRLSALAPGLRGPVTGGGRPGRDRLFPRGHSAAAGGRIRRGPGGRIGLDARTGKRDPRHPSPQPILDHPGSLCLAWRRSRACAISAA